MGNHQNPRVSSGQGLKLNANIQLENGLQNYQMQEQVQLQNPLIKAFQKGILKKQIIASNNKLVDTNNHIKSSPTSNKPILIPRPRISLEQMLLSRRNYHTPTKKGKDSSIVNDLILESDQEEKQEAAVKAHIFKAISLSQEHLITIQNIDINTKYKFINKIGEGGFGAVYKCQCLLTHQQRAVKVMKMRRSNLANRKIIQNEISILLKLDHPNIIKIYQVIHFQSTYYIVTEYCKGGNLADYLQKHSSKGELFAKKVMYNLLSAVRYIHVNGVIHRDLKMQNIVLRPTDGKGEGKFTIKIIDFGFASCNSVKGDQVVGTLQYLAPQSTMGEHSIKSDIWNCGIIFYMLLSGNLPFRAPTKTQIYAKIKSEEICLQSYEWRNVSFNAKDLLFRMLSKNHLERPTASEVLNHSWFKDSFVPSKYNAEDIGQKEQIVSCLSKQEGHCQRNNLTAFLKAYLSATKINQAQRQRLIQHFNRIDLNQNGLIETSELKSYFEKNKIKIGDQEIAIIMRRIDLNQNQKIDLNQFIFGLAKMDEYFKRQYFDELFGVFDYNRDGYIDKRELKRKLRQSQYEEIEYLYEMIDKNDDHQISLKEFTTYLESIQI